MKITEHEMRGLLAGKCLPGDMRLNEDLPSYLVRKFDELQQKLDALEYKLARSEDYSVGVDTERMEYIKKCNALTAEPDVLISEEGARAIRAIINREISGAGRYVIFERPTFTGEEKMMPLYTTPPAQLLRPVELPDIKTARSDWSAWNWIEHLGGRFQNGKPGDYIEFGSVDAVAQMLKQYRRTVTAEVIAEIADSLRQQGYEVKSNDNH